MHIGGVGGGGGGGGGGGRGRRERGRGISWGERLATPNRQSLVNSDKSLSSKVQIKLAVQVL